jgi:uncharacterized membrane protein YhaH (DUF805 family)
MKMTFADAVKSGLKNYAKFKGTADRREFWYFYLFNVLLNMVTSTLDGFIAPGAAGASGLSSGGPLYMLTNLILVIPNLTMTVRRFHDAGHSGKWLFLWLAPVAAFLIGGGFAVATNPISNLETATNDQLLALILPLLPAFILASGVGIFQLVINLKASKSAAAGNRYAIEAETETGVDK